MAAPTALIAFGWMVATTISFALFFAVVRYITVDIHPMQAAFLRYAVSMVLILPLIVSVWRTEMRTAPHALLAGRGLLHSIGVMMWFIAISTIPLTDVAALSYLAPVFIILGAVVFIGETFSQARVTAVAVGLIGAMIIIRPGFDVVELGQIAMLIVAPIFAASDLITKKLTQTVSHRMILVGLTFWVTVGLTPVAILYWTPPSVDVLLLSVVTAALATAGHYCFTRAIAVSDISAIQPYRFLSLIWAAVLGFALFDEIPGWTTWLGGTLIIVATTMAARRESRQTVETTTREAARQDNPEGND